MAPSDLRSLFKSTNEGLTAQDVFADRHDEWSSIVRSLVAHSETLRSPSFSVEDFAMPRRNVLVFFGVGGIGKTEFSKRLEKHLAESPPDSTAHWPPVPEDVGRLLPVRIDLSRQSGVDFEGALLAIRLAAGRLGCPMPAFDIALRRYWEVNHPGDPLDAYLRRSGFLRRAATAASLPEQVQAVIEDVAQRLELPTLLGTAAITTVRAVAKALRERHEAVRTLARCERLADLLEADQDLETLSFFAHLLAWDLAQVPADRTGTLVVLLDTFEEVGDRTHRDLERLLQRVIWLMPNALFVITGRNRLQWDDPRLEGQLDWAGPYQWPQLTPGTEADPRQHLVGYLSDEDREQYLRTRLVRSGVPVIPPAVRREIATRSHGLPLYLDLAVMRFLDLFNRTQAVPGPEEFRRDFPALVARIVRDLTPGERSVLRTVSLLDSFTVELATAAAAQSHDAAALNLVDRPFIINDVDAPWPYRLHDLVRSAIRQADATTDDRWSSADWHRAAQRCLDALGTQLPAAGERGHRRLLMVCLTQGLRIACEYELDLSWLMGAAWRYVAESVWEPIDVPAAVRSGETSAAGNAAVGLARTLHAIARRQRVHREETAEELSAVLSSGDLPPEGEDLARYYLAECQRHLGRLDESAANMKLVASGRSPMAGDAARGLAHIARHRGDFPAALEATEALAHTTRYFRALGHLWWVHADVPLACSTYGTARDLAVAEHNPGQAALAQASLAMAASFDDRTRAAEQIRLADEYLEGVRLSWAEAHVRIAGLLRDAGLDEGLPQRAAALEVDAQDAGLGSSAAYARFAVCFHHAVRAEEQALRHARERMSRDVDGGEYAYLVEISHFLDDSEPPQSLPRAKWIGGTTVVRERWRALVDNRRAALEYEQRHGI